jgi:hypothetical protein
MTEQNGPLVAESEYLLLVVGVTVRPYGIEVGKDAAVLARTPLRSGRTMFCQSGFLTY